MVVSDLINDAEDALVNIDRQLMAAKAQLVARTIQAKATIPRALAPVAACVLG